MKTRIYATPAVKGLIPIPFTLYLQAILMTTTPHGINQITFIIVRLDFDQTLVLRVQSPLRIVLLKV